MDSACGAKNCWCERKGRINNNEFEPILHSAEKKTIHWILVAKRLRSNKTPYMIRYFAAWTFVCFMNAHCKPECLFHNMRGSARAIRTTRIAANELSISFSLIQYVVRWGCILYVVFYCHMFLIRWGSSMEFSFGCRVECV